MIVMMSVNAGHNEDEDQGIDWDNIDNLTSRFFNDFDSRLDDNAIVGS